MGVVRDTDSAILRMCIVLDQNRLLPLGVQMHGNTVASISQLQKIIKFVLSMFFSSVSPEKIGLSQQFR